MLHFTDQNPQRTEKESYKWVIECRMMRLVGAMRRNTRLGETALGESPMAKPASHEPSAKAASDPAPEADPEPALLPELYSRLDEPVVVGIESLVVF